VSEAARLLRRSVAISGHRTSVTLESAFWQALQAIARRRGRSLNALVSEVDAGRAAGSLSSALRVFVLAEAARQPATVRGP
jgi:predicted DNA-binding ribbon-helix-helix protein